MTDMQSILSLFRAELAREGRASFSQGSARCACERDILDEEDESGEGGVAVIRSSSDVQVAMSEGDDVRVIERLATGNLGTSVYGGSGHHIHDVTAPPPLPQAGSPFACEGGDDPRDFKLSIQEFPWRCIGTYFANSLGSGALVSHRIFLTCAHTLWSPGTGITVPKYVHLGPLFISANNTIPTKGYVRDLREGLDAWVPNEFKSASNETEKAKHDWGLVLLSDSPKQTGSIYVAGGWGFPNKGDAVYGYGVPSPALICENAPDHSPWQGRCSGVIWGARGIVQDVKYRYIRVSGLHSQPGQSGMVGWKWHGGHRYICGVLAGCSQGKAAMKRFRPDDVERIIDWINANPSEYFANPQLSYL